MSEDTPTKDVIIPAGFPDEVFNKAQREMKPQAVRSFAFENDKQRMNQYLTKGLVKPGRVSFDVLRRAAQAVHIARICINTLKEKITKTEWVIQPIDQQKRKTGVDDERIKKLTELFKHPNSNSETFRTLLDKILEDLLVLDTVSIEKVRDTAGELMELHYVDSATIRPVYDEHGNQDVPIPLKTIHGTEMLPVSYLQIFDNSQYGGPESGEIVAAWPKNDFMYFNMHPQGAMESFGYGLSPLEAVLSVVANILNADMYNGTYFQEGAFPPVIIQLIGQMDQRDLEAAREYLYSELQGNFHKPAIMAGKTKAEVLNLKDLTNRDMEFMEYMKFLSRLLAAAYGLSAQDINITEDLNRATSEVQKSLSEAKGYGSILHLLKETFNNEIVWGDFGYDDLEFEWVQEDSTDPTALSQIHDLSLKNGTMTLNEVRQKNGELPYGDWADEPMILTATGYVPIEQGIENIQDAHDAAIAPPEDEEADKAEGESEKVEKSIFTPNGYKVWMDDRGYSQPFIFSNILGRSGMVIKPPVAVNLMSQSTEESVSGMLANSGLNVYPVTRMTHTQVMDMLRNLPDPSVCVEFMKYTEMTPEYDSEKWRTRFGGSRKFNYYMTTPYVDGYPLSSALLKADMARDPDSYTGAVQDLAMLWMAEKNLLLGDRRADQYIINPDKRAFGFDYQFIGDQKRYNDSKGSILEVLKDIPQLAKQFKELTKEDIDAETTEKKSLFKRILGR